jgi:hypothetical protein
MVQQWFGVNGFGAIPFYSITFISDAFYCSDKDAYHPGLILTAAFSRIRSIHVYIATHAHVASVAMKAVQRTHGGPEKP